LRRQRKVPKRKATRWSGSFWGQSPNSPSHRLALRERCHAPQRNGCLTPITQTCGARRKRGRARTRLRLRQSLALIRFRLRSSAQPDGWWARERIRQRAPAGSRFARPRLPESDSSPKARLAGPSSADGGGVKGGSCLSEASSDAPRRNRAAQVSYWGQTPISLRGFAPHPQGEPKAQRIWALTPKTTDSRVAFSLLTFSWRRKRK
jgi:hypothetical protein